ncbi:MAG: C40 family peptidase, partial [Acidimicrobiales bacterium]
DGIDLPDAVYAYNHSQVYVDEVLSDAAAYAGTAPTAPAPGPAAAAAVRYALAQLGTPYRWGGETPGVGFDCSGLVQAAERAAGITLPRVAQAQFEVGTVVPPGEPIVAGDLVFFGRGPHRVEHVGLVVGPGLMVDAPHAGAVVRLEGFPTRIGAWWGDEVLLGATRP